MKYTENSEEYTGPTTAGLEACSIQLAFEATLDSMPISSETSDASPVRDQAKVVEVNRC